MGVMTPPDKGNEQRIKLTDEELLQREFKTDDPESLPNLSEKLPPNYETAEIEFWYNITPPDGQPRDRAYIWCAHDEKATHWKGYVMKTDDGVRFLIGAQNCGKEVFDLEFNTTTKNFREWQRRQGYLVQHKSTVAAFPGAIQALESLLSSTVLTHFEAVQQAVRQRTPDLHRQLLSAIHHREGSLVIEERVTDFAAEERRAARHEAEDEELQREKGRTTLTKWKVLRDEHRARRRADNDPIYKTIEQTIGQVSGPEFLKSGCRPRKQIATHVEELRSIYREMAEQSTDAHSTKKLRKMFRLLREIIEDIDAQLQTLGSPLRFFAPDRLKSVSAWASKDPRCKGVYKSTGRQLLWEAPHDDVEVSLPTGYEVPDLPCLEIFKLAVSRGD